MKTVVVPSGTEIVSVTIFGNSEESFPGQMIVKRWNPEEIRKRALTRTVKIVGTIIACSLIGLFVHILLLIIIPGLLITFVGQFALFFKFLDEDATFFGTQSTCPSCKVAGDLRPYGSTRFQKKMSLQCPVCGQTAHAVPNA